MDWIQLRYVQCPPCSQDILLSTPAPNLAPIPCAKSVLADAAGPVALGATRYILCKFHVNTQWTQWTGELELSAGIAIRGWPDCNWLGFLTTDER